MYSLALIIFVVSEKKAFEHFPIGSNVNLCPAVAAILKMATSRNFSMSGINSGHHYLPTYQILMISDNVEFLRYCGGHFENGDW